MQAQCILLIRGAAESLQLDTSALKTIQNMTTATSMRVMGDKLLRDRLNALTLAYFTANDQQDGAASLARPR